MAAEIDRFPLQDWLPQLRMIARETGEEILHYYNGERDCEVTRKPDTTPLTEADLAANGVVVESLELLTPDIPVLSEESEIPPFEVRQGWDTYWLVDPLDGTVEFIHRNGEFTVNIALIHHQCPILGVIYAPVDDVVYFASAGHGAYKQVAGGRSEAITCRRLNPEQLTIASSRSYSSPQVQALISKLGEHELIIKGSSLKSCLVAEGRADLYARLGPTSEWDTAAAQCIVEEAGGQITDTQMQPLRYNTKDSLLNPHFFVFGRESRDWSRYL
ncbi:MAG: 3'(2'),5'-bisphosphate nucleotidase CysQ [Gammaproteobacteria bacterium]|nr:3'(2'),5'-bisphosphate nucleotidase CysQ [Gammaproteobacteria bacterium]